MMKTVRTISAMQAEARAARQAGKRIGLVPTMGFLHEGHLSLLREARERCEVLTVSIFVNPTQFGAGEDLDAYPRDFEQDCQQCEKEGANIIFAPAADEMYADNFSTWVGEETLSKPLCGAARPGHFRGVTTVVAKLFNAVLPDVAVFGRKDAQQALIIQRMVRDLNFPVELVIAPLIREPDGLAMSSRNTYLTAEQRQRALSLYRGLSKADRLFNNGEQNADTLVATVRREIKAADGLIDYVELVDRETLSPLTVLDRPAMLAVAASFGKARLIDNTFLG